MGQFIVFCPLFLSLLFFLLLMCVCARVCAHAYVCADIARVIINMGIVTYGPDVF